MDPGSDFIVSYFCSRMYGGYPKVGKYLGSVRCLSVCLCSIAVSEGWLAAGLAWLVCDKHTHTHTAQIYRQTASYIVMSYVLTQYSGGKCHTELALTVVLISTEISN